MPSLSNQEGSDGPFLASAHSLTSPSLDLMDRPASHILRMTRDGRRDREALLGGVVVGWYCPNCGKAIPIDDERTVDRDCQAHLDRHGAGR